MEVYFWNGRSFRENRNFARGRSSNHNLEFWGLTGTISKGNIEIQKKIWRFENGCPGIFKIRTQNDSTIAEIILTFLIQLSVPFLPAHPGMGAPHCNPEFDQIRAIYTF